MNFRKVSLIFLTATILLVGISAAAKVPRTKPLGLTSETTKALPSKENGVSTEEGKPKAESTVVVPVPEPAPETLKAENINETIEKGLELVENMTEKESQKGIAEAATGRLSAFLAQMRDLLYNVARKLGFEPNSAKRQSRDILGGPENTLESKEFLDDHVRTAVGVALGKTECVQRVACRAGRYLRSVQGKDIILAVMQKTAPTMLQDTYRVIKDSAVHSVECEHKYKCLD